MLNKFHVNDCLVPTLAESWQEHGTSSHYALRILLSLPFSFSLLPFLVTSTCLFDHQPRCSIYNIEHWEVFALVLRQLPSLPDTTPSSLNTARRVLSLLSPTYSQSFFPSGRRNPHRPSSVSGIEAEVSGTFSTRILHSSHSLQYLSIVWTFGIVWLDFRPFPLILSKSVIAIVLFE